MSDHIADYLRLSEGGRHCRIVHRSARSERPSALLAPGALAGRYRVDFYGDDIAWLRADPDDGKIHAINPEFGVFSVAKDTSEVT